MVLLIETVWIKGAIDNIVCLIELWLQMLAQTNQRDLITPVNLILELYKIIQCSNKT